MPPRHDLDSVQVIDLRPAYFNMIRIWGKNGMTPKRIIFNDPATIVFWEDGTKTVVKCQKGEKFDEYVGLCAALAKKVFGSNSKIKSLIEKAERPGHNDNPGRNNTSTEDLFMSRYYECRKQGYSMTEIANMYELPLSTVRSFVSKAARKRRCNAVESQS